MIAQLDPFHFTAWLGQAAHDLPAGKLPVVLDVREPWELQTAALAPNGFALLAVPMREIPARLAALRADLGDDQPIACLCHHGMRSLQAANYLAQAGFGKVMNLQGGIDAWSRQVDLSVPRY